MLALTAMLIVFAPAAFAQSAPTVTGTVTDQSGQPVIGATIIEQGTTNGATTGVDGSYSLKLRGGGNSANLIIIGKTKCDGIQNQMRLFGGRVSPKRKATKISHTHTKKHRSNGF